MIHYPLLWSLDSYKICLCFIVLSATVCTVAIGYICLFHGDHDFVSFLSMTIYEVLYTWCLRFNICSARFLDIKISTYYTLSSYITQQMHSQVYMVILHNEITILHIILYSPDPHEIESDNIILYSYSIWTNHSYLKQVDIFISKNQALQILYLKHYALVKVHKLSWIRKSTKSTKVWYQHTVQYKILQHNKTQTYLIPG